MSSQMIVRINPDVKEKLNKLARVEGKTTSQVVRELVEDYIAEHDIASYIDNLWERVGGKLKSRGAKPEEIEKAVKEARKKQG